MDLLWILYGETQALHRTRLSCMIFISLLYRTLFRERTQKCCLRGDGQAVFDYAQIISTEEITGYGFAPCIDVSGAAGAI